MFVKSFRQIGGAKNDFLTNGWIHYFVNFLRGGGILTSLSSFNGKFNKETFFISWVFLYDKIFLRKMPLSYILTEYSKTDLVRRLFIKIVSKFLIFIVFCLLYDSSIHYFTGTATPCIKCQEFNALDSISINCIIKQWFYRANMRLYRLYHFIFCYGTLDTISWCLLSVCRRPSTL